MSWMGMRGMNPFLRVVEVAGFRCREADGAGVNCEADGEWLGRIPMEVSVVAGALRILMPPRSR
jgi:diacylglycerol kinase family enzyme